MDNKLESFIGKNGKKIEIREWKEKIFEELSFDLEKELEKSNEQLERLNSDFEENLKYNERVNNELIDTELSWKDAVENTINGEDIVDYSFEINEYVASKVKYATEKSQIDGKRAVFTITKLVDSIKNIFLQIELPNEFEELSISEKMKILNTTCQLEIGGILIDNKDIINCLFLQICNGERIYHQDKIVQIPLFDFSTFQNNGNYLGLPLIALQFHSIKVILHNIPDYKISLIVNGFLLKNQIRRELSLNEQYYLTVLTSSYLSYACKSSYNLGFNWISKFFLIYFEPKYRENQEDFISNYPELENVELYLNNILYHRFEEDDILSMEIFGIKIYILPLSEEVSTFEKISETFSDPLKYLTISSINCSRIDKIELKYNALNDSEDNIIHIKNICFNFYHIRNGMCKLVYGG